MKAYFVFFYNIFFFKYLFEIFLNLEKLIKSFSRMSFTFLVLIFFLKIFYLYWELQYRNYLLHKIFKIIQILKNYGNIALEET